MSQGEYDFTAKLSKTIWLYLVFLRQAISERKQVFIAARVNTWCGALIVDFSMPIYFLRRQCIDLLRIVLD